MKKTVRKLLVVLLSAMIGVSAISSISSFAAESQPSSSDIEAVESVTVEDPVSVQEFSESMETTVAQPSTAVPTTAPQPTTKPAPKVGNVKNVEKTSFESSSVSLKWNKVSGATGYYVYVCNKDSSNTYKKVATVTSNSATIKNLEHTTQYWFKVSAYIKQDGKIYEGNATLKKTATQPEKVRGLNSVRSSSIIEFEWDRNPKATGYKIYRACNKTDAEYVLYKTITNNKTTSFTDTNIEDGRAYYYSVRPYRVLYGDCYYHSPNNYVKFICGLCAPNYSMTTQVSRVSLSWNHNRWATGYDIYYSTSRYSGYKLLGTTTKNFFNTVRLTPGKSYYFRVQPYKINGPSKTKVLGTYTTKSKTVSSGAYGKSVGNTYVEISIRQQHMWLYKGGKLLVETDVVTGNDDGYHNTPKGCFSIYQRARNTTLYGPGYASPVSYWMAFSGGCGIHDASWRSSYGGNIYKGNGSHGCVNTPYSKVQKIYNNTSYGTPVVVY